MSYKNVKKNKEQLLKEFYQERNLREKEYYNTDFGIGQFIGFILAGVSLFLPCLTVSFIILTLIQ